MRILAVHPSKSFLALLQKHLEPEHQIHCCWDGVTALAELDEFCPDALILHPCLPNKDGLSLLEHTPFTPPVILVLMDWLDRNLAIRFQNLGATAILLMPSLHTITATLDRQLQECPTFLPVKTFPQILHALGFRSSQIGFRQLCMAAELLEQDRDMSFSATLYPSIARAFGIVDWKAVEKAMRCSIRFAWKDGDCHIWHKYAFTGKCPSVRVFLMNILELYSDSSAQEHTVLLNGTLHG